MEDGTLIEASLVGQSEANPSSDSVTTAMGNHIIHRTGPGTRNYSLLLGPDNAQPKKFVTSVSGGFQKLNLKSGLTNRSNLGLY